MPPGPLPPKPAAGVAAIATQATGTTADPSVAAHAVVGMASAQVELSTLVDEVRRGCVRYARDGAEQSGEPSCLIEASGTTVAAAATPAAAPAPPATASAPPAAAPTAASPATAPATVVPSAAPAAAAAGAVLRSSSHTATYSRARKNANSPVAPAGPLPENVRRAAVFRCAA